MKICNFFKLGSLMIGICLTLLSVRAQETDCGNGIDDDGDTLVDCLDPDCEFQFLPSLPSTGSDGTLTGILPVGSPDLHWEVSLNGPNGPYQTAVVMTVYSTYLPSPWANATYISDTPSGDHTTRGSIIDYYRLGFFLPCTANWGNAVSSGTVCLQFTAYVDNSIEEVYVNGVPQSSSLPGIPHPTDPYYACGFCSGQGYDLLLCDDWQAGWNSLIIGVTSAPSKIGLLTHTGWISSPLHSRNLELSVQQQQHEVNIQLQLPETDYPKEVQIFKRESIDAERMIVHESIERMDQTLLKIIDPTPINGTPWYQAQMMLSDGNRLVSKKFLSPIEEMIQLSFSRLPIQGHLPFPVLKPQF